MQAIRVFVEHHFFRGRGFSLQNLKQRVSLENSPSSTNSANNRFRSWVFVGHMMVFRNLVIEPLLQREELIKD
jgi:carboxypeptidase C (cathepsin A)